MATAEEQPRRGGARRVTLSEGQRFCITGMSLANPAATAGHPLVTVLAEVGHETHTVGTLSSEEPIKPVLPPVELGDGGEFVLRHDAAASSVRLYGYYLDPPERDGEGEPTRRRFFVDVDAVELGGEEEEAGVEHGDEAHTVEDLKVRYEYDSECGEGDSDDSDEEDEEEEEEEEEDETSESSDVEVAEEISKRRKISSEDSL